MLIPTPKTWIDGETVTPQAMNEQVRNTVNALLARPACVLTQITTTNTYANGGFSDVQKWDSSEVDTDGMSTFKGNGYIFINTPGLYYVNAQTTAHGSATGRRLVAISLAPGGAACKVRAEWSCDTSFWAGNVSGLIRCVAGDKIYLSVYQSSGIVLTSSVAGTGENPRLSAVWVAP